MKYKITQVFLLLLDIFIVIFAFLFVAKIEHGTRRILADFEYWRSLVPFTLIWVLSGLWSLKYNYRHLSKGMDLTKRIIKSNILAIAIIYTLMFVFRRFQYSRSLVLGTIVASTALEVFIFVGLFYALRFNREKRDDSDSGIVTRSRKLEDSQSPSVLMNEGLSVPVINHSHRLPNYGEVEQGDTISQDQWMKYLGEQKALYDFMSANLDLSLFGRSLTLVLQSSEYFNINIESETSRNLFINLNKINDFRRLNLYLIRVNELLTTDGIFFCNGQTIIQRRKHIYHKFTPFFGVFTYFCDFLFRRVAPKLPVLQGWYFALTGGKNRALSETEMLGRFYFCGFELMNKREIKDHTYFILKKVNTPRKDSNPTYGPLIKLKRLGKDKKVIYINKLRTMHPYSEYLQDYVFQTNSLQKGGKFKNDFRVTAWGRVLRALWIDELPQLLNFFKGDLSLVGVRALSEHYFSLYPQDMQELRTSIKPGLMPPFYADMPSSLDEIVESERRFIEKHKRHPFRTDWVYFWKGVWNILIKKARSN
jgi:lipopolysaccharide/colanic/teichoic acid biosynthesis glycosyltransferase